MNKHTLQFVSVFALPTILIVVGLFTASPLAVGSLILLDAATTTVRMLFERLAARHRPDESPATGGTRPLEPLYETVTDKRGRVQLHARLPPVYPRNVPYVLELWPVLLFVGVPTALVWGGIGVPAGALGGVAATAAPLVVARQYTVVRARMADETYETATSRTVRRTREFAYLAVVTAVGGPLVWLSEPTSGPLVAGVILFGIPKLLFDARDAGSSLWPLSFDPTAGDDARTPVTDTDPTAPPKTTPWRRQFSTQWRVVRRVGVSDGVTYSILSIVLSVTVVGGTGLFWLGSLWTTLVAATVAALTVTLATIAITFTIHWFGAANEQYRVYDDCVVGYDTFLEEPQWRVSADEITGVTRGDTRPGIRIPKLLDTMPYSEYPVVIERGENDPIEVEKLADPEGFADAVRALRRGTLDTSIDARTRE